GVRVVGKITFDPAVTEAIVYGKTVVEYAPQSVVAKEIAEIWKETLSGLENVRS
nr:hypothetical protein [Candidatus Korarchaeota archaeon]NIW13072.1 hypothetical protein [Candidatus Thorarchaeota archaeon]